MVVGTESFALRLSAPRPPPPPQVGRPGMRICNRGFHGVSASGAPTVTRGANDIYAVFDNHQCYPE